MLLIRIKIMVMICQSIRNLIDRSEIKSSEPFWQNFLALRKEPIKGKISNKRIPMPQTAPLALMRLKDRNEALGLAVRLLCGEEPFRDMPVGGSIGTLISSIDVDNYAFVQREKKAVGFACWQYCSVEQAEAWRSSERASIPLGANPGRVAVMYAVQAIDLSATRHLMLGLRDGPLLGCDLIYYYRDYGSNGRPPRIVRLVRPKKRQTRRDANTMST